MSIRTGTPFIRVRIGSEDLFQSGDGRLKTAEVTQAEGEGLSSCQFSIYDPGRVYANKYFEYIFKEDGLDPLFIPDRTQNRGARAGSNVTFNGNASIDGFDSNRIKTAIEYYLGQGLTPQATAALIGNMMQESSLNPSAVGTDQSDGVIGVPAASEGLIQWTYERKEGLPSDYEGQLEFALMEMTRHGSTTLRSAIEDPSYSLEDLKPLFYDWILWGDAGSRWEYAENVLRAIESTPTQTTQKQVQESKEPKQNDGAENTQKVLSAKVGQQITIEIGFDGNPLVAASFLHTSLEFDLFAPETLVFGGQAAAWVLAQRKQNTAYTNMTLKQIAQKICDKYGLVLQMENDGSTYDYFPQRGISDYEALLIECRRIGYRIQSVGNRLIIDPRVADDNGFTLVYGENLGTEFKVSHTAASDSSGGARASEGSDRSTTGERKWIVDAQTGELVQQRSENSTGTGSSGSTVATTGGHVSMIKPVIRSNADKDQKRKENEKRLKGIVATFSAPTLPEMLLLDPDSIFRTSGFSSFLDRVWVIESITHSYDGTLLKTSGVVYTPLKNKYPSSTPETTTRNTPAPSASNAEFINPTTGTITSDFGMRWGRLHAGVDIGADTGTPVVASASGIVVGAYGGCVEGDRACNGRAGNYIVIDHGNGFTTRYMHLDSFSVSTGQQVAQGEPIAELGNTGDSSGSHLHFEIVQNGNPVDPEAYITF